MYCGGEWNKGPALIAGSSPLFHGTCQTTPKISILTRAAAVDKGMATHGHVLCAKDACSTCSMKLMPWKCMETGRPDIYDLQYILEVIMNYNTLMYVCIIFML